MIQLIALTSGLLFGLGLAFAEMTNPAVVIGFLDISGDWNPSLAVVMFFAVLVSAPAFYIAKRKKHPVMASQWQIPSRRDLDRPLLMGSAIFGIGWGLSGYCPGPGLTTLVNHPSEGIVFVLSLFIGSWFFEQQKKKKSLLHYQ